MQPRSVSEVLSFGAGSAYLRVVPLAAALVLLGLFVLLEDGPDKPLAAPYVLLAAGGGFIAFALWLRLKPGEPVLVLSPEGVRYRIGGRVIEIPWSDVQSVESVDIRLLHRGFGSTERDVPVVVVTEAFYRAHIHLDSLWWRGPGWNYQFIRKGDQVQIALFPHVFGQTASGLRAAIEARWRAFSDNPNVKAPPAPLPSEPRVRISSNQKLAFGMAAVIAAAPLMWWWQWVAAWLQSDAPEGSRTAYVERLLEGPGVPARGPDGTFSVLRRADVAGIEGSGCRKKIARDLSGLGALPSYEASWRCVVDLRLASGGRAQGAFRLVVERRGQQHPHGDYRRTSALVAAPLNAEEAATILCEARPC